MNDMAFSDAYTDDEGASEESLPSEPISLSTIVSHFVASKQSLAATTQVYRAHEIVNAARTLLETLATLDAKTIFLKTNIKDQLAILSSIRAGLGTIARDVDEEYQVRIRTRSDSN